jgi:protein-S-isoprenylcysteine O-methyltransferase Ste14
MVQVHSEEQRLEKDFGEAYRQYKARTRKLIPFIW